MPKALFILTACYPCGDGDFIEDEIPYLAERFPRIVLVPVAPRTTPVALPGNVTFDLSVGHKLGSRSQRVRSGVMSPRGLTYVARVLRNDTPPLSATTFGHALAAAGNVSRVRDWTERHRDELLDVGLSTWALPSLLGAVESGLRMTTRAHRGDLYINEAPDQYLPFHSAVMHAAHRIHPVSDDGARYLSGLYPELRDRISVRRLGVVGAPRVAERSQDGILRVVSCSYLIERKRPLLMVEVIRELARHSKSVLWTHFGGGSLLAEVQAASLTLPANVRAEVNGFATNAAIVAHYATNPVDAFVSTTASEGIPVSMMEAISAGVPVVAPDVGGVREIVSSAVGALLEENPDAEFVARSVLEVVAEFSPERRRLVREFWSETYSAAVNYPRFADELGRDAGI